MPDRQGFSCRWARRCPPPWPSGRQRDRDLVGYGATPPAANWPNGARIAVQFVINYEEGAESTVLNGDELSEGFLSEMVGAARHPDRAMAMESLYEYGSRAGFWRLHRLFVERDLPVTVFGVAAALAMNPEAVEAMLKAQWKSPAMGCAGSTTNMCPRRWSASISRRPSPCMSW
jgi:peptidoglycan/xylan/chitin deacetylase (PgdA/CDA1 family)